MQCCVRAVSAFNFQVLIRSGSRGMAFLGLLLRFEAVAQLVVIQPEPIGLSRHGQTLKFKPQVRTETVKNCSAPPMNVIVLRSPTYSEVLYFLDCCCCCCD